MAVVSTATLNAEVATSVPAVAVMSKTGRVGILYRRLEEECGNFAPSSPVASRRRTKNEEPEGDNNMSIQLKSIIAVTLLAASFQASSASILLRTGVDSGNNVLGENVTDPSWTISVQSGAFAAAEVVNSEVICCGMETVGSQAVWISDPSVTDGSPSTGWGVGPTAVARRQFDMTGLDITTAALSGSWRVADFRLGIYLNGNLIQADTSDGGAAWTADQVFNLAAGSGFFLAGVNTLELRGSSGNSAWDGFWLDGTVTAREIESVPEPATLALFSLGLAGLGLSRRRKAN